MATTLTCAEFFASIEKTQKIRKHKRPLVTKLGLVEADSLLVRRVFDHAHELPFDIVFAALDELAMQCANEIFDYANHSDEIYATIELVNGNRVYATAHYRHHSQPMIFCFAGPHVP